MAGSTHYPHRLNSDGSFDSICPMCYATVGRSVAEAGLAEHDMAHVCDPSSIAERGAFVRAEALRRRTRQAPAEIAL
jgi:hypothetical protein